MASSNYTQNLHLSAWTASDRPKRADFVSDNEIIDRELGGHLADAAAHLTAAEKSMLAEPFAVRIYTGTGESSRAVSLGFQAKFVIVYKRGASPVSLENGVLCVNSAAAAYGNGGTAGLNVTGTGITVNYSTSDGIKISLNENGAQYAVIAFK